MFWKILRLGLINVAVAITAVPIDGTLNRVMISEFGLPATLVAALIALPYFFSPLQVWIGGYSDTHPLFGLRRTPYIVLGLLLCALGTSLAPSAAVALSQDMRTGIPLGLLAFGMWGMGFNVATVSYLALATELAGEDQRARAVGVMWFMLILAVIITGITLSRLMPADRYDQEALFRICYATAGVAVLIGLVGVVGLEGRSLKQVDIERRSFASMLATIRSAPQARLFFVYLVLLLIAILGQDVLLEPYAADVFGVPIAETTRYTSIWGTALLLGLLVTSPIVRRLGKPRAAAIGGVLVAVGLVLIGGCGMLGQANLLMPSLIVFGFGSGISTAANLALMLDMTLPGQVGVFVGAWGMADALARMLGTFLSGVLRDVITLASGEKFIGYGAVFGLQALSMVLALVLLPRLSVTRFQREAAPSTTELIALAGETSNR